MTDALQGSRILGGNSAYKRNPSDFYPTPPDATIALLDFLDIPKSSLIWEPACGEGHMVKTMRDCGYQVIGTDIQTGTDFLTAEVPPGVSWIITNPPFSQAEAFIRRCEEIGKPYALLLKAHYWHAKRRAALFRETRPAFILPLTWRPDFLMGKRGGGSPLMDVLWCVWDPMMRYSTLYEPLDRPGKERKA